ncbi:ABC transporter ATP-binding protein [Cohnella sp. JJ-181]|uniref:ABC transporter ATP-binding protein n=1 Tax=Cohnella rhizoplanae TaxID=2974897 RepID=UPI0022FFB302|nr:ABC transporter ATP-binding protein [Cohnella sp. JJ-181]CAI6030704.1 putative ABC transporter ATP-binding protein [Cohnella sp. JJ-181]
MHYLRKYVSKYGLLFTLSLSLVALEGICDLLLPTLMSHMIDRGVLSRDLDVVAKYGMWMLAVTAAGALSALGRNVVSSRVSQRFGADLRGDLFRRIQYLSLGDADRFDRASLVTRLTNDVTQVQNFANGMMRIFAKAPLLCIGGLIMAVRLNPQLSLVFVVAVPIVILLILLNMRVGFPLFLKVQSALDRLNGSMREYLSGVRSVKAFNRFDYEADKFEAINGEYQARSVTTLRAMSGFGPAIMLVVNLGVVAIIWLGGIRVDEGRMQVGNIIAFVNYMTQILFSLMTISWVFNMFIRARASSGRIAEVLELPEGESAPGRATATAETRAGAPAAIAGAAPGSLPDQQDAAPSVSFDDVGFSYDGQSGERALRGVTLSCEPGETLAVVGSTGSGKTTLVSLVLRLYDQTEGVIRIGGVDHRQMDVSALRAIVAVVPQRTVLFSGTIADNLRWGDESATQAELEAAAAAASAHDFILALPDGYDTMLGQSGVNLSGGQKQRLSIARALIRKPRILILDDCTSALDAVTESKVKAALKAYGAKLTCLLIAQRVSSVVDADRIAVLDDGEVVGLGTHAELLRGCEVYRDICRSQFGEEAIPHASGI